MNLREFLIEAKKNTYASEGEENETELGNGGKELVFEEDEFRYRDRYFGFNPFSGQEVVWRGGEPFWSMNYRGETLSSSVSAEKIYSFLQKALNQVEEDQPFRGPEVFVKEDFKYSNRFEGNIRSFEGKEEIFYKGEKVYELLYHGGVVD
ncbi:MAG: DUF5680 domain-containing protein [Candidatus Nanohaloarchaeota archaeon QJJ-9]|nr:DUF5680 domain-containing protein [Candidatus Nanohaloarchaeota archaeon QJJ-9]